jgi:choline dehydrogenase-like flavoprotein
LLPPPQPFPALKTGSRIRLDVKNLFIVDGSIWVTSGGVNPTSTIQALALYIADNIKMRLATLFD